jgi:hypothetical protein
MKRAKMTSEMVYFFIGLKHYLRNTPTLFSFVGHFTRQSRIGYKTSKKSVVVKPSNVSEGLGVIRPSGQNPARDGD